MPQAHMWTVVMGLCWQPGKGFSLLRACCPSCWDLGCYGGGGEDAATPSSCPPTPLTTQKPGPTIMDVPWCLAQGLLMPGFSMHVALQQGHPLLSIPQAGDTGAWHSTAMLQGVCGTPKASRLLNNALLALLGCMSWLYLWESLRLAQGEPCLRLGWDWEK